jgi:hypothetical protein
MDVQFIENNGQRQYAVVPIDVYTSLDWNAAWVLGSCRGFSN